MVHRHETRAVHISFCLARKKKKKENLIQRE